MLRGLSLPLLTIHLPAREEVSSCQALLIGPMSVIEGSTGSEELENPPQRNQFNGNPFARPNGAGGRLLSYVHSQICAM